MQIDYDVGDVVVCVDDSPSFDPVPHVNESPVTSIYIGSFHRVTGLIETINGIAALLDGESPHTCDCCWNESGWNPDRFRKLLKADSEFTEQMRKLKPHKQKVEA